MPLTPDEEQLLKPVPNEEQWRRKQREVIAAANKKNQQRDEIQKELFSVKAKHEALEEKYVALLSEMEALKQERCVTEWNKGLYSALERLQRENSILVGELDSKEQAIFNGAQDLPARVDVEQLDDFVKMKIEQNAGLRNEAESLTTYLVKIEKEREKDFAELQSVKNELESIRGPRTVWGTPSQIRTLEDFPALGSSGRQRAATPSVSTFTADSSASSAETMCQLLLSRFDNLEETLRTQVVAVKPKAIPVAKPQSWGEQAEVEVA